MAVTVLGTGHVFDLRARVQEEIFRATPSVVALELDPPRFHALMNPQLEKGKAPFVYRILGDFQKRVANAYGVEAGDEMKAAAEAARDIRAQVALIDRDARTTFQRLFREMPFGEKMRLFGSSAWGLLAPGKSVDEQVREIEADYGAVFTEMGKKFPTLKRVLLDERNAYMAEAIRQLSQQHPNLVAVMGDAHVDGVVEILAKAGIASHTVRLKQLRDTPAGSGDATASASWRVDHHDVGP